MCDTFSVQANRHRVERALAVVERYAEEHQVETGLDLEVAIIDLLADLMHLCDARDFEWWELAHRGRVYYTAEVVEARRGE